MEWHHFAGFYSGAALSKILARMVRSSVIEELGEDYVRTAWAKGLSERKVIYKHVLKNGLIPVVTILGLQLDPALPERSSRKRFSAGQALACCWSKTESANVTIA